MASFPRRTATDHRPNGHQDWAPGAIQVPPSTMAAQLINNLATKEPTGKLEQDDLWSLLNEVKELEISATVTQDVAVKLDSKHKMIYVFARAVLEQLGNDDPFKDVERLLSQALEALDFFIMTIKELPGVLNYSLPPGIRLRARGQEPLWVWLFPRVLTLLGQPKCERLTEKIKDFFYVSFQAVARSPMFWDLNSLFFRYLKACVSTALIFLQCPPTILSHTQVAAFTLPSEDINELQIYLETNDTPPSTTNLCTYSIPDAAQGIIHVSYVLSMLVDISMEAAASHDATPAFQDYLNWILDSYLTAHELYKRWRLDPALPHTCADSYMMLFCSAHALLISSRESVMPVFLRKGYTLICILAADILKNYLELSTSIQFSICRCVLELASMSEQYESMRRVVREHLIPVIQSIVCDETALDYLDKDEKIAFRVLYQSCGIETPQELVPIKLTRFDSRELNLEFQNLALQADNTAGPEHDNGPPSKRRKVDGGQCLVDEITSNLYSLLIDEESSGIEGLNKVIENCFTTLEEADKCKVIDYLGRIPCGQSGYLTVTRNDGKINTSKCLLCEGRQSQNSIRPDAVASTEVSSEAILAFSKLIKSPAFIESRKPRVLAMIALRRFALHFDNPEFLNFEVSPLAQWCLQSLNSTIRELRVAAGRTLATFLRVLETNPALTKKNWVNTLGVLRSFPEQPSIHLQETYILALGQVGKVARDEELNIVLLALVTYLGHSNSVVSGVAFNEIMRLARSAGTTVERMFSPFWGTIAVAAVKDLLVKPQITQSIADLLGISVSEFLGLTKIYTLPWLVSAKKNDVVNRMSEVLKYEEDWEIYLDKTNLAPILAHLLVQNVPDMESYVMSLLRNLSSRFDDLDFTYLMRVEPASPALYLLKAVGTAEDAKKSQIRLALQLLASHAYTGNEAKKSSNVIGAFLEEHILGLVAIISRVVNDVRDEQPIAEKDRSVKALEETVRLAKFHTKVARPQICGCLQSALAQKELQASALAAWETMLINLEDDDVEAMLESTFATVIQHWDSFDESTRKRAESVIQYLLKNRKRLMRKMIVNLPSLSQFPELADVEIQLNKLRTPSDPRNAFQIFSRRVSHENSGVVSQALVELRDYLRLHQSFLQASAVSEQPDVVIGKLVRAILDTSIKLNDSHHDIAQLSAECIGLIGCLDPNRVEAIREQHEMVMVSNFYDSDETTDFILFTLEEAIVPAFLSTTDTVLQGFLSYVMQELLEKCDFRAVVGQALTTGENTSNEVYSKWNALPRSVQDTLTPFLSSRYALKGLEPVKHEYPMFRPNEMPPKLYNIWLRNFVLDLLQKGANFNTELLFPPLRRAIGRKELSIGSFLLPYLVLYVIVDGTDENRREIGNELLAILQYEAPADSQVRKEDLKLCIEAVFRILDYLARWVQEKQSKENKSRGQSSIDHGINFVNSVVQMIPPEIISHRAVECKSYSRALFYWEQHIRHVRETDKSSATNTMLLQRLQDIYTQIDEPDGIEGISAHLHVLDIDQQILAHRKAGRWTTAQSWYEIKLAEKPDDLDVQLNLLTCLKESGQHDVLLNYVEGMHTATKTVSRLLPFAVEASWATGRWSTLEKYTSLATEDVGSDFNISIGRSLLALHKKNSDLFSSNIRSLREQIAFSLSTATTSSLGACHDNMLKFHVLTELEMIAGVDQNPTMERTHILESLNRRLEVIGSYLNDKQYLLGIRRAAMQLSSLEFTKSDVASAWLTSARLARKGNAIHQSFNAVLHASELGDESATIEHARLLWKEGHHRKAIQSLQGAIDNNAFMSHNRSNAVSFTDADQTEQQNLLTARAHLLLAKWLDSAGQTHSSALRTQYQLAAKTHTSWEKGHYYLGRHYNKLLESEKDLAPDLQSEAYVGGETARLVIENYLRSLSFGTKYVYQTLPRLLTLWLDLGIQVNQNVGSKYGNSKEFIKRITDLRKSNLEQLHGKFNKHISRMPAYIFYTALPQIVARIAHPNVDVYKYLQMIIFKVVLAHPQQGLWSLLAVCTSNQTDRRARGASILQALRSNKKDTGSLDIKAMVQSGERLTQQLLLACTAGDFQSNRTTWAHLIKDLGFNPKACLPSLMAMPVESVLMATLPTLTDNVKTHKAFSRDVVTIDSFLDEVMVLSSLQKPRKLTARGSDGRLYGLMCKPKDDLRKDQRLMEFNSMINRSLKRDAESSRRQLYIKTYAVTPLNEECGIIEWVDGLKTLRDILLSLYKSIGVSPNYRDIEMCCKEASKSEAKLPYFTEKVLGQFPPVFHKWFVQQFPEPSSWFAARLRYTRSCAVMSMVGTILGLGDRHGENILFEEGNGGTFHVDFNCLFDKGLTFVKPERVPFRLTHNMVDAMGMYGYEGPFRKSSELTLKLLRQHEETLMTILEAFVYDPTLDLLAKKPEKKKKEGSFTVPQTAQGVLDSIQRKVRGLLAGESVPLGVEGQVDELIKQATNQSYLAAMYIGWCAFL